jgi:hypothetical protein
MTEQHTPGPWAVNWAGSGRDGKFVYDEVYVYSPACGVEDIAVAADIADPLTGKPSEANARLIAAAPEMLAALEKVWSEGVIPDGFALLQDQVCDAIAKATAEGERG